MKLKSDLPAAVLCYALSIAIACAQTISGPTLPALIDNGTIVSSRESIDTTSNAHVQEIVNAASTGTTVNKLAKLTGIAPGDRCHRHDVGLRLAMCWASSPEALAPPTMRRSQ